MFNSIQIFGVALLGGLGAGEFSRRALALPRTTGYVVFGLLVGQSGLGWIAPYHIESNQLFIDLALGLILFELGYQVPLVAVSEGWNRLSAGLLISLTTGATVVLALLVEDGAIYSLAGAWTATQEVGGAVVLGGACTALVLTGAQLLGRRSEHQHLLILGTIVLGVGTAIHLDISAFLPMLLFGYLTQALDRNKQVVAIRIASDARIFLVATFVLAGAALDIDVVVENWPEAVLVIIARFAGQLTGVLLNRNRLCLGTASSIYLSIGLQPMSSIALVLLANMQTLYSGLEPRLTGALLATILLMQLFGPLATQTAIKGFGEATYLQSDDPAAEKPASNKGSWGDKS